MHNLQETHTVHTVTSITISITSNTNVSVNSFVFCLHQTYRDIYQTEKCDEIICLYCPFFFFFLSFLSLTTVNVFKKSCS